jgi:hypothetical protein
VHDQTENSTHQIQSHPTQVDTNTSLSLSYSSLSLLPYLSPS